MPPERRKIVEKGVKEFKVGEIEEPPTPQPKMGAKGINLRPVGVGQGNASLYILIPKAVREMLGITRETRFALALGEGAESLEGETALIYRIKGRLAGTQKYTAAGDGEE